MQVPQFIPHGAIMDSSNIIEVSYPLLELGRFIEFVKV
jgi:hypothetical protein